MRNVAAVSVSVLVFCAVSCGKAQIPKQATVPVPEKPTPEEDWRKYYPVAQGSEWQYQTHVQSNASRNEQKTVKVTGAETINGVECHILEHSTGDRVTLRDFVRVDEQGVTVHRRDVKGTGIDISPPERRLVFPLRPGASWEWEGGYPPLAGTMHVNCEVGASEEVEVPAGKYKALKVVTTICEKKTYDAAQSTRTLMPGVTVNVEPLAEHTAWLACEVGMVKETLKVSNVLFTSSLIKYSPASRLEKTTPGR
jgi:hypothetical protein